jgi:hypothetical protein
VSNNRGAGDPGDAITEMLITAGYESFNFAHDEDKETWMERQEKLGILPDGVPGPWTSNAIMEHPTLAEAGNALGLWVTRPGDV